MVALCRAPPSGRAPSGMLGLRPEEAAPRGSTLKRSQYWENPICCSHVWTSASFQLATQGRIGRGTSSPSRRSARLASADVVPLVE